MANVTDMKGAESAASRTETGKKLLWQIEIESVTGFPDRMARDVCLAAEELGLATDNLTVASRKGFLVEGRLSKEELTNVAARLLAEPVVHQFTIGRVGDSEFAQVGKGQWLIHILPKSGVTDPEADSAAVAIRELGLDVDHVRTYRKFLIGGVDEIVCQKLAKRILYNESIEQLVWGPLEIDRLGFSSKVTFRKIIVPLISASDDELVKISREGQLSLTLVEMQTIREHFQTQQRDPTDIELETIAQTWSEHCSHKTLAGRVTYDDGVQVREFGNLLKETIFAATQNIRHKLKDQDWCVSVFKDNAGIVKFTDDFNVTFKVETHNRPSAIEPYGGANTGLGGVIRDTMGTGLGAKPICSTDVFCFASPDRDFESLPPGVLHPKRIMKGVVSGVRDYGNRMGIPTVNGAIYFDDRYIGNPMVFCGNIGLLPHEKSFKKPQPHDLIVAVGGRTGRDGIHGATFSSVELTDASEKVSGGAVQIGNAIVEKMVLDVLLAARDRGLYTAVTDCGAGGFSSAVGEMGEQIGAEVWLDRAPLKYAGLTYTEIWISEAQERMILSVPESHWAEFSRLCQSESVEATIIGRFEPTGKLKLTMDGEVVGELEMSFLHQGRPPVKRLATYRPRASIEIDDARLKQFSIGETLHRILAAPNVASKQWIIRQYDHEVLAGSVIKPLVGAENDGPSDAAVVRPLLDNERGLAVACGMNPLLGDLDPYHMAASSIDEAIRNCVAVGADPNRIGILDNFCWGYTDRPETLGSLVRAAIACQEFAEGFGTPFISGKDSLNNEFSYSDSNGIRQTISIPCTLLISALGQVPDVKKCVTMDLKRPGNLLYVIGVTGAHLGGSHALLVHGEHGKGVVPQVDSGRAKQIFQAIYQGMNSGLIRSCHDLSEGGLAACVAEMAFAGGLGATVDLKNQPIDGKLTSFEKLFSESNSRFVCEVQPEFQKKFEGNFTMGLIGLIGTVTSEPRLRIVDEGIEIMNESIVDLKRSWQKTFDWN